MQPPTRAAWQTCLAAAKPGAVGRYAKHPEFEWTTFAVCHLRVLDTELPAEASVFLWCSISRIFAAACRQDLPQCTVIADIGRGHDALPRCG